MARNDGRIEKGQPLRTAISAKAWNRAQDAADIVLGVQPGIEAGPLSTVRLPCVKAILRDKGYFGEVRIFNELELFTVSKMLPSTTTGMEALGNASNEEKELVAYALPHTQTVEDFDEYNENRFAICIGNDSNEYAISGLAITRVRVHNNAHRYARLPRQLNAYYQQAPFNGSWIETGYGCLDSCFWGPARIIGYAMYEGTVTNAQNQQVPGEGVVFSHAVQAGAAWAEDDYKRWALVHF